MHNGEMLKEDSQTGMGYFLVVGEPNVNINFPWSELIIIIIMMLIIIRLLFKKQVQGMEDKVWVVMRDAERKAEKGINLKQ